MNVLLQIGIGIIPATIVVLILMIKRRVFTIINILFFLCLLLCNGGLLYIGTKQPVQTDAVKKSLSQTQMMKFANALYKEEAYEQAWEMIDKYSGAYGYDDECRLLSARLYLVEEDYVRANGLYDYLAENTRILEDNKKERELAADKVKYNTSDLAMMNYMKVTGKDSEDYGYKNTSYSEVKNIVEQTLDDIRIPVDKEYDLRKGSYLDWAESISKANSTYQNYLKGKDVEDSTITTICRDLEQVEEEEKGIIDLECFSEAKMKAQVLDGNFDNIVENLSSASSYNELMIASELYMGGLVKENDFSKEYRKIDRMTIRTVKKNLDWIYKNKKSDLSVQEAKQLKERIDAIESELEEPVLSVLKRQLIEKAESEAGNDKTKVHLQLAKIENYFQNEISSDRYLNEAVYESQDCKDDTYVTAMAEIMNVISNDEESDSENIKNVSNYVDTVLDHSLIVNVEGILAAGRAEETVGEEDTQNNIDAENEQNDVKGNSNQERDFRQSMVDYASRKKSAISIGRIDTSDFEKITARVQIASDYINEINELKKGLNIYDCGAQIDDFTIRKLEYKQSNLLLCCDVSGSMDTAMGDLKSAVTTFISEKNQDENIAITTFDDSIVETVRFGSSDSELLSLAEEMQAEGGTDMFSAVKNCLEDFHVDDEENNVIILLSDGEDNNPKEKEEIEREIGVLAEKKGITIYTLGLGEAVDTEYLTAIADSGDGDCVYVSDSSSLNSFYDLMHGQVAEQYEISYEAVDTMTMSNRTLEVSLESERIKDCKSYSIGKTEDEKEGVNATQNLSVRGLNVRYIYKSSQDIPAKLKGTGFKKGDEASLRLNGNIDYDLDLKYEDEETYSLTIPAGVAVGVYNVEVSIGGKRAVLQNGLSVLAPGSEKMTAYGPYIFTSLEKIETDEGYLLRGAVTMNGWLHFKGDVNLSGNTEQEGSIGVKDASGSYVEFDKSTAEGIGKFLADKGIPLDLPPLEKFKLYNDQTNRLDYSDYMVDEIEVGFLKLYDVVHLDTPSIRLYPNQVELHYKTGNTILPYQDEIFEKCDIESPLFSFDCEGSGIISNRNVGVKVKVSYGNNETDVFERVNVFNAPVYMNLGDFHVELDTLEDEYSIGAKIKVALLDVGVGADLDFKGLQVDKFTLHMDKTFKGQWGPIPVTYSDFSFGASDIKDAVENRNYKTIKLKGSLSIAVAKVKEYIPKLEDFIGNVSLFELPDTSFEVGVSPFSFETEATLKFLSEVTIAQAELKLGTFNYSNAILDLDSAEVKGVHASLKHGIMWNPTDRCKVEISGTGELDAHSRFLGTVFTGTGNLDVKWWLFNTEIKKEGMVLLGMYVRHDGQPEFLLSVRQTDSSGKIKGKMYYLDMNGKCGSRNGVVN